MSRATIDFGIDLGTTTSILAVSKGIDAEIIKNNDNLEFTFSAVYINRKGSLYVGETAKSRLYTDEYNAFGEFKLDMGTDNVRTFIDSNRVMRPEELSAEILKELKSNAVQRQHGEIKAAIVTVPAAFQNPQCEATKNAARLAGIDTCILLQEPVAAALAYGFQDHDSNGFWFVYDLGGGTFDAAVVQVNDGLIQVINHEGDNYLGGKLVDWSIVERLLIPEIIKEYGVKDFHLKNPRWSGAIAKLKGAAEKAKIQLSSRSTTTATIDDIFKNCQDYSGKSVDFDFDLSRSQIETLMEPFIARTINVCKKALMDKRLSPKNIEKMLLVGGPTLTPYLQGRLAEELGIPLVIEKDPITVVARGAAIFAGSQRIEAPSQRPSLSGHFTIDLIYKPTGPELDPLVGGRVLGNTAMDFSPYTVEFVAPEAQPAWRSGKIKLSKEGTFTTALVAERGKVNLYLIEMCDSTGTRCMIMPDRLAYTVGTITGDPILAHSIKIGLHNQKTETFFAKGNSLPVRRRKANFRTTSALKRGESGTLLTIPILEGEQDRAGSNQKIAELVIQAEEVRRDLPVGSDIEILISIDKSMSISVNAFVPLLDQEFDTTISYEKYRKETAQPEQLARQIDAESRRLEELRSKAQQNNDEVSIGAIGGLELQGVLAELQDTRGSGAPDERLNRLFVLRAAIDEVEEALEWPTLVATAHREIEIEFNIVSSDDDSVTQKDKSDFATLKKEILECIELHNPKMLKKKTEDMDSLGYRVVSRRPSWWVNHLEWFEKNLDKLSNLDEAGRWITHGRRAINNDDLEALKAAVRQLSGLLPPEKMSMDQQRVMSDVTR